MDGSLVVLLVVNLVCAVVYAIVKIVRKEGAGVAVFFIFLPILGFALYFLPRLLGRIFGEREYDKNTCQSSKESVSKRTWRGRYDRDSLVQRNRIERMAEHPNVEEELGVVPVEDAMAIDENKEKRELLLRQLKKDMNENYKVLLAAENDEDSESVHYVAATKMEIYRSLHQNWLDCFRDYEESPEDIQACQNACEALRKLVDSQVLSGREQTMYQKKYCSLIETQEQAGKDMIQDRDYEEYLFYLMELGRYEQAQQLWEDKRDRLRSEKSYMRMTEMFYQRQDEEKFRECIAQLREDKQVRLTAQGMEKLRYWMQKE